MKQPPEHTNLIFKTTARRSKTRTQQKKFKKNKPTEKRGKTSRVLATKSLQKNSGF